MPCEDYREALIEAAAAAEDSELTRELRAHLEACASCRAALSGERQLFTAIDTGLRAAANAEVPVSLLPRVRAHLHEQPVPRGSWVPIGAAVATAVALVAVVVFTRGIGRDPADPEQEVNRFAHNIPSAAIQSAPPRVAPPETAAPILRAKSLRSVRNVRAAQAEELVVLIPEGQKRAIEVLLASVQQSKAEPNILLAEKSEGSLEELGVSPLVISPIEVKPLADMSAESPSEDGKTRR